ncbi:EFR1 family ferrodoxin [uncultured Acetobacteroides sp.]|uniref:EFR1 family ferrodoxin n=1 Tax=uncultured Acetobacteroides sp. TaxID=1760811 RepID=UPI0029F58862|nr:EFR1 family ferrodoxin [uncultured Acetobacteroides sp.]
MEKLKLYFFSGTGNARRVAQWIEERAIAQHVETTNEDIAQINRASLDTPSQNTAIGIVSPTHGFNYPPIVVNFIFRFPRSKHHNRIFLVNTRAGLKLSKLFLPGMSGIALWLAALVLIIKGYRVVGMRSIDMPSNWISLHPGVKEKVANSIVERCQRITFRFADTMLSGKNCYRAAYDIIQDMLILPIAIVYYILGRFIIAKTFYANSSCNGCNLCISSCPIKAIKLVHNEPFWTYRCESCMRCMNICPKRAIQTGHGFIFGIIYLTYATVIAELYSILGKYYSIEGGGFLAGAARFILESVIVFTMLIVGYRILHRLKRVAGFRLLIEYTSLTRYKFWRRYFLPNKKK